MLLFLLLLLSLNRNYITNDILALHNLLDNKNVMENIDNKNNRI